FPFGKLVAGIERHAGDGNRRHPEHDGRLEALVRGDLRLPRTLISTTITHDRPAVVFAGPDDVDLIAAVGTVFVLPYFAGSGMNRETEGRAMPERIDFGFVSGAADKWVVVGNTAVVAKAQHFAAVALRVLRIVAAIGHEDRAVT